jgi:hypothetical protein
MTSRPALTEREMARLPALMGASGWAVAMALVDVAIYADEAAAIDASFAHRGRWRRAWFLALSAPESPRTVFAQGARP